VENHTLGPPAVGGAAAQIREHGEHPTVVVRAGGQAELRVDARHVLLDGAKRDEEPLRDRLVRAALGHQLEHLSLARRQLVERVVSPLAADELAHHGRVERRAAVRNSTDGRAELLEIGDAILQEIPDPLGARLEQRHRIAGLDVLGEQEDPDAGVRLPDLLRRAEPFVRVRRRHPDVDDGDVGLVHRDVTEEVVGRA
jgi:hypothetical protein